MSVYVNFGNSPWAIESPVVQIEGEHIAYYCNFQGAKNISSPSAVVYRDRSDVTATVMPSGSHSTYSNTNGIGVSLKPLQALTGGKKYVIAVTATVDGKTVVKKLEVICHKASQER